MDYEQKLECLIEKAEGKSEYTWSQLCEILDCNISPETLRRSFNGGIFSGYNIAKYYQNKVDTITGQDIEDKKFELQKERKKVQAVNLEYHKNARDLARNELVIDMIEDSIKNLKPLEVKRFKRSAPTESTGVLFISDSHYGKEFKINGLFNEVINEYNPDIFKARMWNLLAQINSDRFYYDKLIVCDLGDCIDGILRMSSLNTIKTGVVDSCIEYAEFMATWLNELSNRTGLKIDFYLSQGNHDMLRLLTEKKTFEDENMCKIIHKFIELRLKDNTNIHVSDYSDIAFIPVHGVNILAYHGDCKDMKKDIEYFENIYNIDIDILCAGHLHRNSSESIGIGTNFGDKEIVRVPSIMGMDNYAKSIKKSARAGCKFMLFSENGKELEKIYYLQ